MCPNAYACGLVGCPKRHLSPAAVPELAVTVGGVGSNAGLAVDGGSCIVVVRVVREVVVMVVSLPCVVFLAVDRSDLRKFMTWLHSTGGSWVRPHLVSVV